MFGPVPSGHFNPIMSLMDASFARISRASSAHLLAETTATLGPLLVILSLPRTHRGATAPAAVGVYIGAAYFFTPKRRTASSPCS